MVWAVDCGVVHVGSDGWGLRPQMKVGYKGNTVHVEAGAGDLRNGLSVACVAQLHRVYEAEGGSIAEVRFAAEHVSARCFATGTAPAAGARIQTCLVLLDCMHRRIEAEGGSFAGMHSRVAVWCTSAIEPPFAVL